MEQEKKMKKPIYKRWWFWFIIVVVVIAAVSSGGDKSSVPTESGAPTESSASAESETPTESVAPAESTVPAESTAPVVSETPAESTAPVVSETPAESPAVYTAADLSLAMQSNSACPFVMTDKASAFLNEHSDLFPADVDAVSAYVNYEIEYKHLSKNIDKYGDEIIMLDDAYVISADEVALDNGQYVTILQVVDNSGNSYIVYYLGEVDVFEDDTVDVYAIPLGTTSFDNVGGGTTLAVVTMASTITKQ